MSRFEWVSENALPFCSPFGGSGSIHVPRMFVVRCRHVPCRHVPCRIVRCRHVQCRYVRCHCMLRLNGLKVRTPYQPENGAIPQCYSGYNPSPGLLPLL